MAATGSGPISYDQFRKTLAEVLLVEEERITPQASFTKDLYVDSLRLVELVLTIEQLGAEIPSERFWEIQTVGDAYGVYVQYATGEA
jgi:acyl carrier protein